MIFKPLPCPLSVTVSVSLVVCSSVNVQWPAELTICLLSVFIWTVINANKFAWLWRNGGKSHARLTEGGLYGGRRRGCVESSTLVLVPERVSEGSESAGWHRVHQQTPSVVAKCCVRPQTNDSQSEVYVFAYVWLSFSVFLLNVADVIHQFPTCPCLSVWHERTS